MSIFSHVTDKSELKTGIPHLTAKIRIVFELCENTHLISAISAIANFLSNHVFTDLGFVWNKNIYSDLRHRRQLLPLFFASLQKNATFLLLGKNRSIL